jgi:hypothetical protein
MGIASLADSSGTRQLHQVWFFELLYRCDLEHRANVIVLGERFDANLEDIDELLKRKSGAVIVPPIAVGANTTTSESRVEQNGPALLCAYMSSNFPATCSCSLGPLTHSSPDVRCQQVQPGNGRCATCDTTAMAAVTTKTSAKIIAIFFTIVSPLQVTFTLLEPTRSLRDNRHILALSRAGTH